MTGPTRPLAALKPEQANAAAPDVHAWVAASAGTGKTQVLSARVLRLLLQGTQPHAILCLTFTKLAAAEMQTRVFDRLAFWARCDEATLAADLRALRSGDAPEVMARARRLFLQVLDDRQGLSVQTIHAFAQSLIAAFPLEAGITPGFATLDDRSGAQLRKRLLAEAIEAADAEGDQDFLDDLARISISSGEARLAALAGRLASHHESLAAVPLAGFEPMLRRGFGLPSDGSADAERAAALAAIAPDELLALARTLADATTVQARTFGEKLLDWLATGGADFDQIYKLFNTADDTPRKNLPPKAIDTAQPQLKPFFLDTAAALSAAKARLNLYAAAAHAACHLRVGKRLAADWRQAKARLGVVDYDDMIAAAERLLLAPGAAEWVRFKLDQRIDHILVDEAQDTNARQWEIVRALARGFYDGEGARDVQRTLFVVGDFKQAIFSFQGSDPKVYRDQREILEQWASDGGELWRDIGLATNFRSVPAILQVVDAVADTLGETALDEAGVPRHQPHRATDAGAVTLWPPVTDGDDAGDEDDTDDEEPRRPARTDVRLAHEIAAQIARWLDPRDPLILPAHGRPVEAQDILVLVRSRSSFSTALVAALHELRVPVAGVDRLKLTDPLAVADLMALARFALQPGDDLTLAALLVSPFLKLDFDTLFGVAHGRAGSLWDSVNASTDPRVITARDWLRRVLGFADFAAPYEFFERVLSAPDLGGRASLLARLGEEARDAIDAVLDQALAFEAANAPSLQGFLAWIDSDDIEIKRDPDAPLDAVRLMTVHGAKGLQAPVVILADATRARKPEREAPVMMQFDNGPVLPVFLASRKGLTGPLAQAIADADHDAAREHCRLLYVALTRAEDLLFIGGALAPGKTEPPEGSWHHIVGQAMDSLSGTEPDADGRRVYKTGIDAPRRVAAAMLDPDSILPLPGWAITAPPPEARPPRPLSPSALAADDVAAPPAGPAARAAARRGAALHALFERLPAVPPDRRRTVAEAWCRLSVPELDAAALATTVLTVLDDPQFAAVFAPDALAEAPVAATVGDLVIAGTVDRLLITPDRITIVDFKTGRRVPASAEAVEPYHLRQMAAYVAAVARVFPDREVSAALLYTEGPRLVPLPPALLQLHHPQADLGLNGNDTPPISAA